MSKKIINELQLPQNWEWSTMGEVCTNPQYGYTTKASDRGTLKLLRTTDITGGSINWDEVPYCHDDPDDPEKYLLNDGDIVISRAGSVGYSILIEKPERSVFASYLIRFMPLLGRHFFSYFLQSPYYWAEISDTKSGIALANVNAKKLQAIPLPIPPLPEQHRIVAKIEQLFSELEKGVAELTKARETLALYRQSLLKAAFEGRLTEKWRRVHADELESADQLLDRIREQRDKRYKEQLRDWEKAVDKWEASGKEDKRPAKPRKPKKTILFSVKDLETLPTLPVSWKWVTLGELVSGKERSMQSGPFGSNLRHSEFTREGVLVIGIDNVHEGRFSMGSQNRISEEKFEYLKKYQARPNDLLITVMASIGRTCVIPKDLEKSIITKHVYRISMEEHLLCPEFYNLVLQSETISRKRMFENAQGQTRPGLNSEILRELPVPLCDFKEQKTIVMMLTNKLLEIEQIQNTMSNEISKSHVLRQSILKKAFSGKLVSQDPNDEPASELLKRIQAERDKTAKEKKNIHKTPRKREKRQMADLLTALKQAGDWINAQKAFRQCGISDGAETDQIEALYIELRDLEKAGKVDIERRGQEDWLKLQETGEAQDAS